MALQIGINCGFIESAPSTDPQASAADIGGRAVASMFTSPAGSYQITSMGFYQSKVNNSAQPYELGVYSHDGVNGKPNARLSQYTGSSTTASTAAWYTYTGLSYALPAGATTLWLAAQVDTANSSYIDRDQNSLGSDYSQMYSPEVTTLPATWDSDSDFAEYTAAIYALYEAAAGGLSIPVLINYYRHLLCGGQQR